MKTNIVDVFCIIDDFSKLFDETIKKKTLEEADKKGRNRKFKMSDSEVMTILILFHLSRYRDLKAFYLQYITHSCRSEFPHLVSYNRFVELQSRVGFKLIAFLNMCCLGQCTGISFIDSTPLKACHIKRAHGHRTMRGWAQKGKSTMGWFYGFKLHSRPLKSVDKREVIHP